jgi:hypothetical protein
MVYWLRRGSIAIVALVVIIGLWWLLGSRGSSDTPVPASSTGVIATADPSAPSSLAPMPTPIAGSDAIGGDSATAPGESLATGEILDCKNSEISVVASTDKDSYTVGAKPELTMTIQNIGSVACTRDVGAKANSLEITSGGYHVWSSDDCGASDQSKIITLQPGKKVATGIEWNGKVTTKGCPTKGTPAKPGRYQVTGKNLKSKSPAATFSLTK